MPVTPPPAPNTQDIWNEALAIVPMLHTPVRPSGQKALILGTAAVPAAILALRYPGFASVITWTDALPQGLSTDKRVRQISSLDDLPDSEMMDFVAIAEPRLDDAVLQSVRQHTTASSVIVIAVPQPAMVRPLMDVLRRTWRVVQPYREHTPNPAYFLLVGDQSFKRARPCPGFTKRLTDKYIPALFTFAKDEYAMISGSSA